jgi:hypothetical protein
LCPRLSTCRRERTHLSRGAITLSSWMALLSLTAASAAQAEDVGAVRIIGRPGTCVTSASLRARVAEILGGQAWPPSLQIDLQLDLAAPRFSLSSHGAVVALRQFEPFRTSCPEQREAVAVAIVVAVENFRDAQDETTEAVARAEQDPAAATAVSAQARSADSTPPPRAPLESRVPSARTMGLSVLAGGRYLWAAAPGSSAALSAGLELTESRSWSVAISGVWGPRAEYVLANGPERFAAQLLACELVGCWSTRAVYAGVSLCTGAVGGILVGEGRGFVRNAHAQLAWTALKLRAAVHWPTQGRLALRAHVDGHVNIVRPAPEAPDPDGLLSPVGLIGADVGLQLLWRLL